MSILNNLRQYGYRVTSQRQSILKRVSHHPQTVEEIYDRLDKKVDLVSVYRTLDLFVEYNIVKEVEFGDGKKRYELTDENKHHHHAICGSCGIVEDVLIKEEEKILNHIRTNSKFRIDNHSLEFFGQCQDCQ